MSGRVLYGPRRQVIAVIDWLRAPPARQSDDRRPLATPPTPTVSAVPPSRLLNLQNAIKKRHHSGVTLLVEAVNCTCDWPHMASVSAGVGGGGVINLASCLLAGRMGFLFIRL